MPSARQGTRKSIPQAGPRVGPARVPDNPGLSIRWFFLEPKRAPKRVRRLRRVPRAGSPAFLSPTAPITVPPGVLRRRTPRLLALAITANPGVGDGVAVTVAVGDGVAVAVAVAVAVGVGVGVRVAVAVAVAVGSGVAVGDAVAIAVGPAVAVGVEVGIGVKVGGINGSSRVAGMTLSSSATGRWIRVATSR